MNTNGIMVRNSAANMQPGMTPDRYIEMGVDYALTDDPILMRQSVRRLRPDATDQLVFAQVCLKVPRGTVGHYWPMARVGDTCVVLAPLTQADRNNIPAVGDCPDFRGGIAERKWDCPLHACRLDVAELGIFVLSACLTPQTRTSYNYAGDGALFRAEALSPTGFAETRAAIMAVKAEEALAAIERLELKHGLPHLTLDGEWFRNSSLLRRPYLFTDLTEHNVDRVLEFAKRGGFAYVLTFRGSWSTSNGHYAINTTMSGHYPPL
jgi:hypothetical protein